MRRAISNVAANAIQNTSEGGVSVEMSIASREEQNVEIEICISDTGTGMDPKKLDALFRELEQVQTEGEKPMKGPTDSNKAFTESLESEESRTLGLGLAIVSRTLRSMNGQLRVKSEESKGSRFVLVFPLGIPGPGVRQKRWRKTLLLEHRPIDSIRSEFDEERLLGLVESLLANE
jgi:signal transduction histidine kinase